ncbi:Glutamate carboxypeptidase 2 [Escovopsis weberi]|uniref:Glutamate carboxypeptidase 2 n=1 Tax=Escovopsis weberi TaxID=150374 RepID=A0A0M9VW63_ESCWE|nr:Glutamate carboxypeptidase 2 [Escovopsis weberi]
MPSEKEPFYHPVPPSYDEALARHGIGRAPPRDSFDERSASRTESRSLLNPGDSAPGSSRRPIGYHPPTVETDDEDSIFDSDSDADETNQVRREMDELEIDDSDRARGSGTLFGKRINFNITLPRWKWSWRPRLPRWRIQLPSRAAGDDGAAERATTTTTTTSNDGDGNATSQRRRWAWPGFNSVIFIIFFARVLAFLIIIGFIYFLFASGFLTGLNSPVSKGGMRFDPEDLRIHLQKSVDPRRMRASVKIYSSYAHIAGTEGDYATAMDVQSMFSKAGLDEVQVDQYYVYLNYPRKDGRTVQLMDSTGAKAEWTAALEEEERGEETAGRQTYAFHGHSKSGDVKGPLIYANYGSREDYQKLKELGIDTKGAIALVRYYGTQTDRALKVKGAELAGFAGCLIYSDPNDDGFRKGEVAPGGRYMPPDGVQRGSVSLMSWVVGDVLTPGWESTKDMPRLKLDESPGLVKIPSLPLAWRDAQTLLERLKGHGQPAPEDWKGGVPRVEWWTGNSSSPIVRLQNEQDEVEKQPIWNVYGKIMGMEQTAKSIILGNHRDAWGFGATDPHTGTAIMIELARIFGDLVDRGWRPLRTIEFMSWDAEEYNLIGSTEFVEKNLNSLRDNGYAYINLDTAIFGNRFSASGSPVLQKSLLHAIDRVVHPHENLTLRELWDRDGGRLGGLGAGSDYVAFQDIAGTSSIDLEFADSIFPYHSSYDDFNLVDTVIDPGFVLHAAMAQVVGLMLLDLADRPILPFDMLNYGRYLEKWTDELEQWTKEQAAGAASKGKGESFDLTAPFSELKDAARTVTTKAIDFQKWELDWNRVILMNGGWEPTDLEKSRMDYNNKMALFETQLLDLELGGGIPNRTQFKHVVFGPQLWSGYDEAFFPAIRDLVDAQQWSEAGRFVSKTAALIKQAASMLQM